MANLYFGRVDSLLRFRSDSNFLFVDAIGFSSNQVQLVYRRIRQISPHN